MTTFFFTAFAFLQAQRQGFFFATTFFLGVAFLATAFFALGMINLHIIKV